MHVSIYRPVKNIPFSKLTPWRNLFGYGPGFPRYLLLFDHIYYTKIHKLIGFIENLKQQLSSVEGNFSLFLDCSPTGTSHLHNYPQQSPLQFPSSAIRNMWWSGGTVVWGVFVAICLSENCPTEIVWLKLVGGTCLGGIVQERGRGQVATLITPTI